MLTKEEKKVVSGITFVVVARFLGLFLLLPVLAPYVKNLPGSTPLLTGLAVGIYGLTQALLQIPFGYLSDKYSRKGVISFGLLVYALGSFLGGIAQNIWMMLFARFLQGAGAISSAAIALAADLIREEVRTVTFAHIGAAIGMSFAFSIVAAPFLAGHFGVPFIFFLTGGLSLLALLYLWIFIKEPQRHEKEIEPFLKLLPQILRDKNQMAVDLSIGILHLFLVSIFTVIPVELIERFNFPKPEHWKIYLPVIIISLAIMVPAIIAAERKGKMKPVFLAGIAFVALGFASHLILQDFWGAVLLLLFFFIGFHLMEPILPSMLTKFAGPERRGIAVGVYNTVQFSGAFIGGFLGGLFLKLGAVYMLLTNLLLSLVWLLGIGIWIKNVEIKKRST
ncbi:MFS transporter [Aquifex aeolicus]|uniref:Transporter (Major facilitator family) n=1 Tax=Aquifex aeolicus (strain VF5) TaxID=224324 RepID=O67276_AQUAE|nr:MFS transporter [Aquifex aeolicus]AAC07232.1 transporter (major facilitator family) [Aquifex aeolicus VF5]